MPTYASEFIHAPSVGNDEACRALLDPVTERIVQFYKQKLIEGYDVMVLHDDEECERQMVEDDWKRIVQPAFPILYVRAQPFPGEDVLHPDVERYLVTEGFILVR